VLLTDVRRVLSSTPAAFRALLSSAPDGALAFREAPTAWTPREVMCHVAEAEVTDWRPRVEIIVSDSADKRFTPFDREGGARRYAGWSVTALLDELERLRRDNLTYLSGLDLDDLALASTGIHPEFGAVTLAQLLACWAAHDLAHVNQISRALLKHVGPDVGPWRKYFSLLA
jgi:hypothetical protein